MSARKFRALTDGPGWKKGDVFELSWQFQHYTKGGMSMTPYFEARDLQPPHFEEIKPRKIAVYELDVTGLYCAPEILWHENKPLRVVRVEERS